MALKAFKFLRYSCSGSTEGTAQKRNRNLFLEITENDRNVIKKIIGYYEGEKCHVLMSGFIREIWRSFFKNIIDFFFFFKWTLELSCVMNHIRIFVKLFIYVGTNKKNLIK